MSMDSTPPSGPPLPPAVRAALATRPVRRRLWLRVTIAVLVVLLLAVAGLAAYVYAETRAVVGELHAGEKQAVVDAVRAELAQAPSWDAETRLAAPAEPARPAPAPAAAAPATPAAAPPVPPAPAASEPEPRARPTTILVIGSDRRWGETGPARSDTVALVRVDTEQDLLSVLSIPRDLLVPIPGYGQDKINAAYSLGGAALLAATVRDYLGVRLDHFVEISFDGFGDLVTQIGGVLLPVDQRYYVPTGAGHMAIDVQPGYQRLQRDDALSFVRFRHYDSDFHRAARQQLFLSEVRRQIQASRYDVLKLRRLVRAFAEASASDIDSATELWQLANAVLRTPTSRVTRVTLKAYSAGFVGGSYLATGQTQLDTALRQFLFPRRQVRSQLEASRQLVAPPQTQREGAVAAGAEEAAAEVTLVPDGGQGRALIEPLKPAMRRCAPTALTSGFRWPAGAARAYELEGSPAIAAYATAGSGESVLLMQTTMADPPILANPAATVRRGGIEYDVWLEAGTARQVAWRIGPTRVWLTNTLRNTLTTEELLALAASCEPI
jgi:LCP family protein required for cell wall assembly